MKKWTKDNRYIVWTANETCIDCYDLYVGGILKYENLSLNEFYPIYEKEIQNRA